jgi:hypothetical protein
MPGAPLLRGHDAIRASIIQLGSLGVVYRHLITNRLVDVVDSNRATGICATCSPSTRQPRPGIMKVDRTRLRARWVSITTSS